MVSDSRFAVLAGLRFVLACVVMAVHLPWFTTVGPGWAFIGSFSGNAAVLGFLIVSGYSIGHSLEHRPVGFLQRRWFRIYPLYAAAVLFSLFPFWSGTDAFAMHGHVTARPTAITVAGNLLMLQNLALLPVNSDPLVWTLGIEVICYALAPTLRRLPTAVLIVLIVVSATSYAMYPSWGIGHYQTLLFGIPLLLFAWAWISGFLLHRLRAAWWAGLLVGALSLAMVTLNRVYETPLGGLTVCVSVGAIVLASRIQLPKKIGRTLNYLGDLSYPLYLFHLPTMLLAIVVFQVQSTAVMVGLIFLVSAAVLYIESTLKPFVVRNRALRPTAG